MVQPQTASAPGASAPSARPPGGRLGLAYAGLCLMSWLLHAMAGAEWQRGACKLWEAACEATLNTRLLLTRRDAGTAEQALMRYVLDTQRGVHERVSLRDEVDFVRDDLALESLRPGQRLQVQWQVDETVLDETVPPLVENSITHGMAPRVADDGAGCVWPPPAAGNSRSGHGNGSGVGLSALRRRVELAYGGRARLTVQSAPQTGFRVDLFIPSETPTT